MFLRSLTPPERRAVYHDHILRDIPPTEPKSFDRLERLHADGICRALGMFDDAHEPAGYAYIQHPADCAIELLDFFAVFDTKRGAGLGQRFLQLLTEKERFGPTLVAEVEDPDFAAADEKALCERRIDFYERCGWHDTGVRVTVGPYRCRIFSPSETISAGALRAALAGLYRAVFGPWAEDNTAID